MSPTRKPAISAEEHQRREEAVNYAQASLALDGLKPSADDIKHQQRFINGEIDLAEFVNARFELGNKP